jgi:hypothetical protein
VKISPSSASAGTQLNAPAANSNGCSSGGSSDGNARRAHGKFFRHGFMMIDRINARMHGASHRNGFSAKHAVCRIANRNESKSTSSLFSPFPCVTSCATARYATPVSFRNVLQNNDHRSRNHISCSQCGCEVHVKRRATLNKFHDKKMTSKMKL